MFSLIENEVIKMISKKRLVFVLAILVVLISVFAYGQQKTLERTKAQLSQRMGVTATDDWRKLANQQLIDLKNRLDSPYADDKSKSSLRVRMEQLQYNVNNNINPLEQSAAKFTTKFMEQAIFLFLPLLIIMLSADMVSGEASSGTIKLLLVRNVPRWKILLSKYLTLVILEIVVIFFSFVLSTIISGFFFGFGGWLAPVATGFKVLAGKLDTTTVLNVPQWRYSLMVYALAFFVSVVVGSISFMISILVKSTAASIGIIMSTLVAGNFISYFLTDWKITRYMFMVNLRLTDYLSGSFQPIEGMTMLFSITVLLGWAIASILISFVYFTKQDILV
ncbi:ABC transporter permease [Desulfosporosinus sp. Sb-LF]|uniref:ABC transporter permease n=1 Tax=Desulfosporosinus sp. Sb-LF TaxID=2560027 RepID=UPI00107EFBFA|nr:ABC transporter permease [Desulfosporosinus sp. Sb-LF]TGE33398.1 ABC transporter permease [Desulfosporosinus sp. Sb-LF]